MITVLAWTAVAWGLLSVICVVAWTFQSLSWQILNPIRTDRVVFNILLGWIGASYLIWGL